MGDRTEVRVSDIKRVCEFLNDNFYKQLTNQMIADKFHYHAYYLNRIFKEKIGVTIRRYIIDCRINEAKRRLKAEDTPIGVIAVECGFETSSYFSRHFKATLGLTPSEYRNTNI